MIHLSAPHFYRGTLLNLRHRGGSVWWWGWITRLVEISGLTISSSRPRPYCPPLPASLRLGTILISARIRLYIFYFVFSVFLTVGWSIGFSFFAATVQLLQMVTHIANWVRQILPHTTRIRDWSSFSQRFKSSLPAAGSLFPTIDVVVISPMYVPFVDFFLSHFSLGSIRRSTRRSRSHTPSFRKWRASMTSISAPA